MLDFYGLGADFSIVRLLLGINGVHSAFVPTRRSKFVAQDQHLSGKISETNLFGAAVRYTLFFFFHCHVYVRVPDGLASNKCFVFFFFPSFL